MAPIFVNVTPSNPTLFDPLPMKTPSIVNSPFIIQSIAKITPHVSPTPSQTQIVSSLVPTTHPSSTILNILVKSPPIKRETPQANIPCQAQSPIFSPTTLDYSIAITLATQKGTPKSIHSNQISIPHPHHPLHHYPYPRQNSSCQSKCH
jgi:hypothetical protein